IRGARVIQAAGTFLSYACSFPLLTIYSVYLISYIDEDEKDLRYYGTLVGGLCLDGLLLVIIAQFLSYDPVALWSLRDHQWVYFFFLAVPMTVTCAVILIFRKKLSNRNALRFLSYALLVAATVVIDTIVGDVTLAYIAAAYSLFQIYISVQFEYERTQEDELAQQRIAIMLSQIHPHFLYNVLTSIRALCRTAPHKAEQALTEFTIYLRGNLDSLQTRECIPFMQELEHIKHYVDLEKMRFGDDLRVVFATPVTHFYLPPLTVEPLVENAIRHGVMQRRSGGCVAISTAQSSTHYIISVADDGVGFDTDTISSSRRIGLSNVRGRLASICGGRMEISSAPGEGTTVTVLIPKERGEIAP
ncbi:MAG: histidine kinase, partial [Pyramidobacter sp.]|nr:histidine kinase [Pyramidobacter sp.]